MYKTGFLNSNSNKIRQTQGLQSQYISNCCITPNNDKMYPIQQVKFSYNLKQVPKSNNLNYNSSI